MSLPSELFFDTARLLQKMSKLVKANYLKTLGAVYNDELRVGSN